MPEETPADRIATLEAAVERDPSTALYLPLAEWLRDQGRVEEAIRLCEERKNRPGHGVGDQIVRGRCYLADGRLGEARAAFEAALALDRENVAALKALAGILAHEGAHARAVDLYRAVCRVDPGDLESQTALHQITSGEYAEVCPADVIVGQGDLAWQPVKLEREEDHLSDLGLGLRTIQEFGPGAPSSARNGSRELREFSLDDLEAPAPPAPRATMAPPTGEAAVAPEPPANPPPPGTQPRGEEAPIAAAPARAEEAPSAPAPAPAPARAEEAAPARPSPPGPGASGNRSAFEEWLRRLGGSG